MVGATTNSVETFRRRFALRTASWMFWLAVAFLVNLAAIELWVEVSTYKEQHTAAASIDESDDARQDDILESGAGRLVVGCIALAVILWPIFFAELIVYWWTGDLTKQEITEGILACAIPPLRLGKPNPEIDRQIWLPAWGWRRCGKALQKDLEKAFGVPMIIIALTILPVLLVEYGLKEQVEQWRWLRTIVHVSTAAIWFAFAFEFIVMWSIAPKKLEYCKTNWVDLAIIFLPMISFMRIVKVVQVAKLARTYRLRGLAVKALRAFLLFEFVNRFMGATPEKQLKKLQLRLEEKEAEAETIREQIAEIEEVLSHQEEDEAAQTIEDEPAQENTAVQPSEQKTEA